MLGFSPPEFIVHMRRQRDSVNCSVTGERKTQKLPNILPQVQPQHYPAHLLGQYNNVHPSSRAESSPGDPDVPSPDCFTNKHLSHQSTNCLSAHKLSSVWIQRVKRKEEALGMDLNRQLHSAFHSISIFFCIYLLTRHKEERLKLHIYPAVAASLHL